jgi:hypothetical protein
MDDPAVLELLLCLLNDEGDDRGGGGSFSELGEFDVIIDLFKYLFNYLLI